jgi:hypothetical protein
MPTAAAGLPSTQFGDVKFPSEMTRLHFAGDHHIHKYPHSPGGAPEKLGRGLYHCTIRASFQATLPGYPDLYPNGMNKIRSYAEFQSTLPFQHPSMDGTFPAFIVNWDQAKDAKILSGEKVDIEFLEDQEASFALAAIAVTADDTAVAATSQQLSSTLFALAGPPDGTGGPVVLQLRQADFGLFAALQTAVNAMLAFRDQAQLYGNRYAAAVQNVLNLCSQIDSLGSMQDARAWPVIDVLRQLQAQAVGTQQDLQNQQAKLKKYNVPFTQPLMQISMTLYGDTSNFEQLLALNAGSFDNAMQVPAATPILYYPPTVQQLQAQV